MERKAGRPADEDALLASELPRGHEALAIGDLDELVDHLAVERARPEVLADALDLVRRDLAAVDRPLRVGADHANRGVLLLQVLADPGDRAAGADAGDERGDPAVGLPPDLRARRPVVGLGVARVEVLVRLKSPGNLPGQAVGDRVIRLRGLTLDVGGADHHLGAVRAQQADLLRRHLVGHDEDHLVALDRRGHGEPVAGVARRRLDDRASGPEQAAALGVLEHGQADPVLDAATGVELLELGEHKRPEPLGDLAQPDQRGVADQVEDALDVLHCPAILVPVAGGLGARMRLNGPFATAY